MSATLILKNEDNSFEKLYYQAICLGELSTAERLYAQYSFSRDKTFWRDAFRASGLPETVLMSAIINHMNIPFGSYVFERLDDEYIEIAPWLYAEAASKRALIEAVECEITDPQALRGHARSLQLTADFMEWLINYNQEAQARTEGENG